MSRMQEPENRRVEAWICDWLYAYQRLVLAGKLSALSRDQPGRGGAVSPETMRLQMPNHEV